MTELDFLETNGIITKKDQSELREILNFSLDPKTPIEDLQEHNAFASYHQSKLIKIIFKLKLNHTDLEIVYEQWFSAAFHDSVEEFHGQEVFLKTTKDYEREIKRLPDYKKNKRLLSKIETTIDLLERKEKELASFNWVMKSLIDIHKIKHKVAFGL